MKNAIRICILEAYLMGKIDVSALDICIIKVSGLSIAYLKDLETKRCTRVLV